MSKVQKKAQDKKRSLSIRILTKDISEDRTVISNSTIIIEKKIKNNIISSYNILEIASLVVELSERFKAKPVIETDMSSEQNERLHFFTAIRLEKKMRDFSLTSEFQLLEELYSLYVEITVASSEQKSGDMLESFYSSIIKKYVDKHFIQTRHVVDSSEFGGIWAVGKGGCYTPRLMILGIGVENENEDVAHVVIGKGVTFDTGGLNLKYSSKWMLKMNRDMMGSALALSAAVAAYRFTAKRIICLLPIVENAINERSYRQQDIIKIYNGSKILVEHTDAEGRIILADAVGYACRNLKFQNITTIATLTGAVSDALGDYCVGYITNDSKIDLAVHSLCEETGEYAHHLPNGERYLEDLKRKSTLEFDISNISKSENAGSTVGAKFIEFAVNEENRSKFSHFDIAGYIDAVDKRNISESGSLLLELFARLFAR